MSRQIFEARPTSLLSLDRKAFSKDLLLFFLLLELGKQVTKRGFVERSPKSLQIRPLLLTVLLKTRLIQSVYSETPIYFLQELRDIPRILIICFIQTR